MCDLPAGVCFYFILALTALSHVSCQKVKIVAALPEQTEPIGKPVHLTCKLDQLDLNTKQYGNKRNTAMFIEVLPNSGETISLNEDMAEEYTCTANTKPLKATVIVRTIYPIRWIDAPENQYPLINTDYLVKCQVEGNPTPLVDWIKDGKTIISNEKFVIRPKGLVILNVQESDDGIYACRAAVISTGELDTRNIRVEVQIPPKIEPITDVEFIEGEQASVECRAFGKSPPSYMWIKKTTKENLSKTDRFSVNKQTGLLVIHKVQNDDHSAYECIASNNAGSESAIVKINVLVKDDFKPSIFDFRNITSNVGTEGIIICKVYGRPPPKISIRKFGSRDYFIIGAQPGNNEIVFEQIVDAGQNKSYGILSLNKLNYSDDGIYECIAENSAGETWQNGHVAVVFPPTCDKSKDQPSFFTRSERSANLSIDLDIIKWVDSPENQYPLINTDYLVKCQVEANIELLIDWLKNGEIITINEKFVINPKGLIIRNVQKSDDGIYGCRATVISTGELDTRYIRVEVQIPPKIKMITYEQLIIGEQAFVKCKASGKPPPSYMWIKKTTKEDLSKIDRFVVNKETGMLVINNVQSTDHSAYECVASNNAGSATAVFKLNVMAKPRIFEFFNITASVGNKGIIICKAYGSPPPKISIRKFRSQDYFIIGAQSENNEVFFEHKVNAGKSESYGILTFNKLNRSDDGLYECIAENIVGKSWKTGHVTVEFAPTFEKFKYQAPVFTWGNRPGNLSCLAEAIPNATYEWRLNNIEIQRNDNFLEILYTAKQSLLIVTPGREKRFYTQYKCIARNVHGTANHYIVLKEGHLPKPIQQIKMIHLSPTTILFEIIGPEVKENVPIKGYIAQFKEERLMLWSNKTWSIGSPYILENMEPNKTYQIKFAAFNEVGFGPWGGYQMVTMPRKCVPSEPTILNSQEDGIVNLPYTDFFDLKWKISDDNGEPITLYEIKFCPVKQINDDWVTSHDGCNTKELTGNEHHEVKISPLHSDTDYMIELRALNALGYSMPANLIVKTARG